MEGIKFLASQAISIYHYKSIRAKILKCNADIFFNKSKETYIKTSYNQD